MATQFRKFIDGIRVVPKSTLTTALQKGDLQAKDDAAGKLYYYNGATESPIVTETHTATLSGKTLDTPVVNTSITGGASSSLTIQSATNRDLVLQSQGTGVVTISSSSSDGVQIEDLKIHNNTLASLVGNNLELSAGGQNIVLSASTIDVNSRIAFDRVSDATSSGTALPQKTKSFVDLTGSISTIDTIQAGFDGQFLVLSNRSGSAKTINNDNGTPTNDSILTGTGAALTLEDNASIILVYNDTEQRWMVVGGSGGGSESVINGTAGEAITTGDSVYLSNLDNKFFKVDAASDSEIEYIGVSLDTVASDGSPRIQTSGEVTIPDTSIVGGAFTIGKPVYINPSLPGEYTSTVPTSAGQWIIQAGIATSAVKMVINGAGSATAVKITSETDQFVYANVASVSTTQTLSNGNSIVLATGGVSGITLTLPSPTAGKIFNIKKVDAGVGTITLSPPSGTIDGAASKVITSQYDSLTITSDGTNFFII
jgi:hypothetical protein